MANSISQLLIITDRLPPEIISDIFILCRPPMVHKIEEDDFQRGISIPLILSSVCRLWRGIAQSTPALWTSFRIYIPSRDLPLRIQHARQWLSRSGQLPLSIQIYPHPSVSLDPSDPLVGELINLVNSHAHRWESLEVTVAPELLGYFHGLRKSTATLKTLTLFPAGDFGPIFSPWCNWLLGIRWNNVVHLAVRYIGVGQALEILRLSPQLQECLLVSLWTGENDTPLPSHHLLHARLEILYVGPVYSESVPNQLLDSINLPSLKTFKCFGGFTLPFDNMVAFLNRSDCSLKNFSLTDIVIPEEQFISLLFAMPHLEALVLRQEAFNSIPHFTDRMLNVLADTTTISARLYDLPDQPFLPKLRSLNYRGSRTFSWDCIPIIFGRRTNKPYASESPESNQRPMHSFKMELYSYDYEGPGANVVSTLKRLRDVEGYEIQMLDVGEFTGDLVRDLLYEEAI